MNRHLVCSSFVLGALLSGCGGFNYSLVDTSPAKKTIPEEFFYHTSGSCDDGTLNFVSLWGTGIMLWTDPAQVVYGQGELFLSKDFTFTLLYQEFTPAGKAFDTKLMGRFEFDDVTGVINLENVGTANITTYNGRSVLEVQFTKAINEPALENKKTIFRIGRSIDGLDITRPDYCNY